MALSTVTPGAGGVLVPTNFASDIIEALRPTSVVRKMGVTSRSQAVLWGVRNGFQPDIARAVISEGDRG